MLLSQMLAQEDKRLIVRHNERVQHREQARWADKLQRLEALIAERNAFVSQSKRADPSAGLRQLEQWVPRQKHADKARCYPQAPVAPQAVQKLQPSLRMTA